MTAAAATSPAERMREALELARARDEPFIRAWQHAQREALRGAGWNRRDWETALRWAQPFYEAAYYRDPAGVCGRRLLE